MYRIIATKDFKNPIIGEVTLGTLGGFVEKEANLSQNGACWVSGEAIVLDEAKINGDAIVSDGSIVFDRVSVEESSFIGGNARIFEDASISGSCLIVGNSEIRGSCQIKDYSLIFGNAYISGNNTLSGRSVVGDGGIVISEPFVFQMGNKSATINDQKVFVYECTGINFIDLYKNSKNPFNENFHPYIKIKSISTDKEPTSKFEKMMFLFFQEKRTSLF